MAQAKPTMEPHEESAWLRMLNGPARYAFKTGTFDDRDADRVGRRLEEISRRHNSLRPAAVLEDAKSPDSPLHRYFEWDNERAAEAYRLAQAATLIKAVVVIGENDNETPIQAFVNISSIEERPPEPEFESLAGVANSRELREQAVRRAISALEDWREEYGSFDELRPIVTAIDWAKQKLAREGMLS